MTSRTAFSLARYGSGRPTVGPGWNTARVSGSAPRDRPDGPQLLLLAAGLGRRFGGPKQLAPVGPKGEPLLVVTAAQAAAAGFAHLLVVTRDELADRVAGVLDAAGHLPYDIVHQDGPPRPVPWGTAHAVSRCADVVTAPFAVANADDFYGDPAFSRAAAACREAGPRDAAVIGFTLGRTLSPHGGVARALCRTGPPTPGGRTPRRPILELHECRGLQLVDGRVLDDEGTTHPADTAVSMNLWCLPPWVPGELAARFHDFVAANHHRPGAEFLLPAEIDRLRREDRLDLWLVPADAVWGGLTYAEDLAEVRRVIRAAAPT